MLQHSVSIVKQDITIFQHYKMIWALDIYIKRERDRKEKNIFGTQ